MSDGSGIVELAGRVGELEEIVMTLMKKDGNTDEVQRLNAEINQLKAQLAQFQAQQDEIANTSVVKKGLELSRSVKKLIRGESDE